MKTVTTGIFLLTILGITSTWLTSAPETDVLDEPDTQRALPVQCVSLERISSFKRNRQFSGTVVAARRTRLAFERSARLQTVLCDDGDIVTQEQVLAILDQRYLAAEITELKARVQQQSSVLAELNSGPRAEIIASTAAELAALSADVELRKSTLDRTQGLYERRATSAQALDEVRLAWKASVARSEAVEKKLEELRAGTRTEQIAAQQAVVAALQAELLQLDIQIEDSELKAPFAGTIISRLADEGDMLSPQQPVLELMETSQLEARVGVPSSLISSLDRENYVVLKSNDTEVTGRIRDIVARVDAATRTQSVIIDIDNAEESGLADGALIRLRFEETQDVDGYRVPLTALAAGSRGLWTIYVVPKAETNSPAIVDARSVEILHTDGDTAIVRGTIYDHERIISDGVHRVVPGQEVRDVTVTGERG